MIGDFLQIYTPEYLLNFALSLVPDTIDKRQGSIIYDTLAPICTLLAQGYIDIVEFYRNVFVQTATGEYLDNRVIEQGISRLKATNAYKKGYFTSSDGSPMVIPLGSRFSTISDVNPIIYTAVEAYAENKIVQAGYYVMKCETAGTVGNEYSGELTNITFIQGLANATLSTLLTPARDQESDDDLRNRYLEIVLKKAFGGNVAQYRDEVTNIAGVGGVQVYPIWNGGGTVKLSIVDTQFNVCQSEFVQQVQTKIDPEQNSGKGLGLAPIGHRVTVVTPTKFTANITANIQLMSGVGKGQVEQSIKQSLESYFLSLRNDWDNASELNEYSLGIYISRITASILSVSGVANVTNVQINNGTNDITLTQNATTQQLPFLGEVVLNE